MIHIFYGKDDFLLRKALQAVHERLAQGEGPGALESNTTTLDGRAITPGELIAHATSTPFLAANRLVIVEGLLTALTPERGKGSKPAKAKKKDKDNDPLEAWRPIAAQLAAAMPPTTTLVFVDPGIARSSEALKMFAAAAADVQEFTEPKDEEIPSIVAEFVKFYEIDIDRGPLLALVQTLPGDRWVVDSEIRKLAVYAQGAKVTEAMVGDVVSVARDAKIWDFTDAIVDGNERKALGEMRRMLSDGDHPNVLLATMTTQFRRLVIAKEMIDDGRSQGEVRDALGMKSDFPAKKVIERARRFTWNDLRGAYAAILDADLSVKRGLRSDETALQLAIHRVVAISSSRTNPVVARGAGR